MVARLRFPTESSAHTTSGTVIKTKVKTIYNNIKSLQIQPQYKSYSQLSFVNQLKVNTLNLLHQLAVHTTKLQMISIYKQPFVII